MNFAIKMSLLASGLFLLAGMLIGILKYHRMMTRETHTAPVYVDFAHRAAFLYSFAMLVIAKLLEYSPYSVRVQSGAAGLVLLFLVLTIAGYLAHGLMEDTDNLFRERTFTTTWYMYMLIAGEVAGLSVIIWGFVSTQIIG
jgi:hypothetical protein